MRLLASGLAQVSGIELLDGGILMGLTNRVVGIDVVEHLCPKCAYIGGVAHISRLLRLSAAVYTAAGASHNLNKVIVASPDFTFSSSAFAFPRPEATATFTSMPATL